MPLDGSMTMKKLMSGLPTSARTVSRSDAMTIINESGLYSLVFTSRKPAAERDALSLKRDRGS
ncbi:BRO family protein [Xanthobacter sp. DSM 24535]|uniref:BRO family protein n=1 Tax=Roseixanthobacter psychrophilus TaxID=3119917 RepID=UPI003729074C